MAPQTRRRMNGDRGDNIPPSRSRAQPQPHNKSSRPILCSFDDLPAWYQDNDFVVHGYRQATNSVRRCFESWFYLHNETVNIFSHLIPGVYFLAAQGLIFHYFKVHYPKSSPVDRLVFTFFILTVTACFLMSSTYHTLMNHSDSLSHFFLKLDFLGIVIHTLGNFWSGIYVTFYCEPTLQKVYWAMILSLGSATILITVNPQFQGQRWRTFRACTFVGTALSGLAPLIHGTMLFGWSQMVKQSGVLYYLLEGLFLIIGALCYTTRMPECFQPGRFDIFGSSHQLFHCFVVAGAVSHFAGILIAFDYNYNHRTCSIYSSNLA